MISYISELNKEDDSETSPLLRLPGEIRNEMADRGDPVHSVQLGGIDFPAIARAMGCHGSAIRDPADLTAEIEKAWGVDRPTVLHIKEHSRATQ